MKVCAKCRAEKPLTEFYPRHNTGGVDPYCKACKKILRAESRTKPPKTPKRLWQLIDKNGPVFNGEPCWEWTGDKMVREGYGRIYYQGEMRPAHVVVYKVLGGTVPPGMVADHLCRRRTCVNPAHLRIVTRTVNALENNDAPHARNAQKTSCGRCNRPLAGENLAIRKVRTRKGRRSYTYNCRICLACYPSNWRHAVIERKPPPGAKPTSKWVGPPADSKLTACNTEAK